MKGFSSAILNTYLLFLAYSIDSNLPLQPFYRTDDASHTRLGVEMGDIKFGTDGWRGRIADDYTFANVRRCAQGFANYLSANGKQGSVVVGHDKRFQAEAFAATTAEVLAGN